MMLFKKIFNRTNITGLVVPALLIVSTFAKAQFTGGPSDGFTAVRLVNTQCTALQNGQAFFGGVGDGVSIGSLNPSNCGALFTGVNYNGGAGDGASSGSLNPSNCAPLFLGVNYNGGNGDGAGTGSLTPSNCAPLFIGVNYNGGNGQGYAVKNLQNSNCAPVFIGLNYFGGDADGYAIGSRVVSNCAPLFAGFNFFGGDGDGYSNNAILTGDIGKWLGVTSSNWSVPSNWCGNAVPTPLTNVKIATGVPFQPTLTAASFCAGMQLGSGSNLTLNGQNITITGAITGSGVITGSATSTMTFSGPGNAGTLTMNQSSASSKSLQNILISKAGGTLQLADTVNLVNTLTLNDGNLNTGNKLKLLSSAANTARIAAVGASGSITGNIVAERFAPGGNTGWANLGSPVTNATINHWTAPWPASGFATSGFPGSTGYAALGGPSVFTYKEDVSGTWDNGYAPPNSVNDPLVNGSGFKVFLGTSYTSSGDIKFKVTGTPQVGNKNLNVSYTSTSAGVPHDGWNMVANPYPCEIDWLSGNWTKTNLDNAVYVYNADAGAYASFVGGVSTNGGSRYIASHQGFWVKANSAAPNLVATENIKVSTNPTFLRTAPVTDDLATMRIALNARDSKLSDEMVVRFNSNATDAFDGELEAYKLPSMVQEGLNIMSISGNTEYAIHALRTFDENTSIPVKVKVPGNGSYSLEISEIETVMGQYTSLFDGNQLVIEDIDDKKITPVNGPMTYNFSINSADSVKHLLFRFEKAEALSQSQKMESFDVLNIFTEQDGFYLSASLTEEQNISLHVFNALGQSVKSPMQISMKQGVRKIDTSELATGVYFIKVNAGQKEMTRKVVIQ
jgi:hypothetical protein